MALIHFDQKNSDNILMKQTMINVAWLILLIAVGGCTAIKVAGHWRGHNVVADGDDREWQDAPLYYDDDRRLIVRVTNDATIISLCVAVGRKDLIERFQRGGLTVWFDPQGGEQRVFGIHLPDKDTEMFPRGPGPAVSGLKPRDRQAPPPGGKPPLLEPLKQLAVTYSKATGPLSMTISEVRRTGLDIGIGRTRDGRLVYEFNIALRAAPSLSELKPGMNVGIGILTDGFGQDGPKRGSPRGPMGIADFGGGPGGPGPGGDMRASPGARGFGKRDKPFEVWLKVTLAGPPIST
ncbi:MAG: hypothetical protein PVH22_01845 [Desulfobacteraceae bacterium]|jgi:hypothetical protein